MIKHDPITDAHCQGVAFTVTDEDSLARMIALVLVQEFTLAKSLLAGATVTPELATIALDADEIEDIISRRLKPKDDFHRDGYLFQLIMWLAAHLDLREGDLVALPHAQASGKGQDSIVVHRDDAAVAALSICEDKATVNPRDTVREEVWPEIRAYEAGGRRDELRSNIIATLGLGGVPSKEAEQLVRQISWEGKRRYRVRVTVEATRDSKLFKGFADIVSGDAARRRGETLYQPKLRDWMTNLAGKVESVLRTYVRSK
jgi:hypothetical protein